MRMHHLGLLAGGEVTGSGITMLKTCGYDISQGRLTDNGTLYDQRARPALPPLDQKEKPKPLFPFELVEPPSRDTGLAWTMTMVGQTCVIEIGSENVAETSQALQLLDLQQKDELWSLPHGIMLKVAPSKVRPTQWHLGLCCEIRDDIGAFLRLLPDNPLRDQFVSQIPARAQKPRVAGDKKELSGTYSVNIGGFKVELMFGPTGLNNHGFKGSRHGAETDYDSTGKGACKIVPRF